MGLANPREKRPRYSCSTAKISEGLVIQHATPGHAAAPRSAAATAVVDAGIVKADQEDRLEALSSPTTRFDRQK